MASNRKILIPQYLTEFKCIGSLCEDTCCAGWNVPIDQTTYKKYKKVKHPSLNVRLDKNIKRNRSNPSTEIYAYATLNEDTNCTFLTKDRLCGIQLELGEKYLSNVCSTYPRSSNIVDEAIETAGVLSCPEIARLALLNPKIMEFEEVLESDQGRYVVHDRISTQTSLDETLNRHFWRLRILTIQILQNRKYSFQDRMVILGLFYSKLEKYLEKSRLSEVPDLIASYSELLSDGSFDNVLESIPVNVSVQLELIKEISNQRFTQGIKVPRYIETYSKVFLGLKYQIESSVEKSARFYNEAYEDYYKPYMENKEYIIENYLVNYVYNNLFPFMKFPTPFDNYTMLVVHYAMIKLHLIGVAGFDKGLNEDSIIFTLQSFSKAVEHNPFFLKRIFDLLQKNGFNNMAYMSILIKN